MFCPNCQGNIYYQIKHIITRYERTKFCERLVDTGNLVIYHCISSKFHIQITFIKLSAMFEYWLSYFPNFIYGSLSSNS